MTADKRRFLSRAEVLGEASLTDSRKESGPTWWAWSTRCRLQRCYQVLRSRRIHCTSRQLREERVASFVEMHSWPKSGSRRRSTSAECEGHAQPAATTIHRHVPSSIAATWFIPCGEF
ncbi:unnamed protein product [Ixodes pacificus]